MTEEGWRRVAIVLAVVLAVLLGFGAAVLILPRGGTNGASPTPTLIAGGSPTPTLPGAGGTTEPPTETPTEVPTATPSPSPSPSPTPIPTFPTATIQFVSLQLDSPLAPGEAARTIAFGSNGPGDIIVTAKASSTASVCLKAGTQAPTCKQGTGTISFKGHASGVTGSWTVTAIGVAASTPAVDLTITWPVKTPKLTLTNFRFDGTGSSDLINGFTVVLKARANGNLGVAMDTKSGHDWAWNVLVHDNTDASKDKSYPTPPAAAPKFNVTSPLLKNHEYRITVQNTSGISSGEIPLSGTFSWV